MTELGAEHGFTVDATEDSRAFTTSNLARYRAVVFLNPSGNVLNDSQRDAFRRYVEAGHGFVGIHNATALVLEDWPWYTGLVGARYQTEIATQPLRLVPVDRSDPSTKGIPDPWLITEEAYNFDVNPKTRGVKVLINLDESYSKGGTMGSDSPLLLAQGLRRRALVVHERRRQPRRLRQRSVHGARPRRHPLGRAVLIRFGA